MVNTIHVKLRVNRPRQHEDEPRQHEVEFRLGLFPTDAGARATTRELLKKMLDRAGHLRGVTVMWDTTDVTELFL